MNFLFSITVLLQKLNEQGYLPDLTPKQSDLAAATYIACPDIRRAHEILVELPEHFKAKRGERVEQEEQPNTECGAV